MIPKHLHFIFGLAPKRQQTQREAILNGWGLSHYACIRSAIEEIRPDKVSFYLENEPSGPWWDITRPLVDVIKVKAPTKIFGNAIIHYAHKADVIRLEKLIEHGGIYLDVDVFVHKSFDSLLDNSVVLGREGDSGLCNAVILAEKQAPFIHEWYDNYRTFSDERWNYHSVILPNKIARKFGPEVKRLPEPAFFWPSWTARDIAKMFAEKNQPKVRGIFANHLWEQRARFYMRGLTPGHVRKVDTAFHAWVRPYVRHLPDDYGVGIAKFRGLPRHIYARSHTRARIIKSRLTGHL